MAIKKTTKKERFVVLLEDMNSKIDVIGEQTSDLMQLKPIVQKLSDDMEVVKTDIEIMKNLLKRKVDVEEFEALVKRVQHLESRKYA